MRISRIAWSSIITISLSLLLAIYSSDRRVAAQQTPAQPKTAEQSFKNIKVIKTMPAAQLQNAMSFMAASLGVECSYCHTPPAMEKDDKPTKETARRMLSMVSEINKNFGQQQVVTCATCHRGKPKPNGIPPLPSLGSLAVAPSTAKKQTLPTADEILSRYLNALGGQAAIDRTTSRIRKGTIDVAGVHGSFEVYDLAPNKSLLIGSLPPPLGSVEQGFDGTRGWVKNQNGIFDMSGAGLAQTQRESNFWGDVKLKEQFTTLNVAGRESFEGRDFYLVVGTRANGEVERLFFDVQSGLLTRRSWETTTYFGALPSGNDYEDYRKVGRLRLPFVIRKVRSGVTFLQRVTEYNLNARIDESRFKKPSPPK